MTSPVALEPLSTLADSTRSRLLLVLERHEMTVSELCAVLQLPQSTISRHLKVLGDEQWVENRADGTSRYYRIGRSPDPWAHRLWQVVRERVAETPGARSDESREGAVLASRRLRSREYFATVAGVWESVREELFGRRFDLHLVLALLDPSMVVGDLGCGAGHVTALVAPSVRRVEAVDGSAEMLAAAADRMRGAPNVTLHLAELEQLPLPDGELDVALLALALPYVADPARVLAEAARVVRPGGRVVVLDMQPHDRDELQQRMGHVWRGFSAEQTSAWLSAAGLAHARYTAVPPDESARGPALFTTTAQKPTAPSH